MLNGCQNFLDGYAHAHRLRLPVQERVPSRTAIENGRDTRSQNGARQHLQPSRVGFDATRTLKGRQAVGMRPR